MIHVKWQLLAIEPSESFDLAFHRKIRPSSSVLNVP